VTTKSDPQQLSAPDKQADSRQKPRQGRQQIWASLYLPNLLLDHMQSNMLGNTQTSDATDHTAIAPNIAIVERVSNRQQIRCCNAGARQAGILPGMALNSAYAILPALTAVEYDADKEALLLQQTGEWAMQFSSIVCPDGSNHILIEIGGSERLFDSYASLLATIEAELGKLGYSGSMGIAPTPAGANLLARANIRRGVLSYDRLTAIIKPLPIEYLELTPDTLEGLARSGIRSIAQLLEISPASLTRRFGPACSRYLDQLLGRHPDPRNPLRLSDTFTRSTTLPIEVHDTNALQFATQRMINELAAFLIARDCGVNQFMVELQHERHDNTRLELRFLQATSRPKHLHRVLSERLSQTQLPAPVSGLHLSASTFCEIERDASDFFLKSRSQQKSLGEVIDKLTSRLGDDAIYTLAEVDEHRPEKAWKKSSPEVSEKLVGNWPQRPLWLLEAPKPVTKTLQLEGDAERIETGWWDSNDVRRDYFIAKDRHGTRYWVFRDRGKQDSLFIHGIFS
jgi:protein ImuB